MPDVAGIQESCYGAAPGRSPDGLKDRFGRTPAARPAVTARNDGTAECVLAGDPESVVGLAGIPGVGDGLDLPGGGTATIGRWAPASGR